jgi:(R,R)-butanediol dehydrogenase/meso-butanediol dehydrogenase/diacetyl reductase
VRALRLHGDHDLRVEEVAAPAAAGPGEVVVAPVSAGICGTDVHLYDGGRPIAGEPQILGHEFAGEVVDAGAGVAHVAAGDRVAVMPIVACGRCELCRRGDGHLCVGHQTVGLRHPWGGFGELAVVREGQLAVLPEEVTYEQGALVEPASVAATGVERAGVRPGDRVLVAGGGPIGALAALHAEAAGAGDVVVSEPAPSRAARIEALGFDVLNPREVDVPQACRERSGGQGFDAAIDCAGNAAAFEAAFAAVRHGGTIAVTAVHQQPVELDVRALLSRSVSVVGAIAYPVWSWPRKLQQIASGRLPVERIVGARLPLDRARDGFDRLAGPAPDELKIMIDVRRPR